MSVTVSSLLFVLSFQVLPLIILSFLVHPLIILSFLILPLIILSFQVLPLNILSFQALPCSNYLRTIKLLCRFIPVARIVSQIPQIPIPQIYPYPQTVHYP